MVENYATFDGSVKPRPVTLVLRGNGKPVILMSSSFAELMDALRPFCPDGKIFRLPQRLAEAVSKDREKGMRVAV